MPKSLLQPNSTCVVLGSAPNPRLPQKSLDEFSLICVNNSGWWAQQQGLPTPLLTILSYYRLFAEDKQLDNQAMQGLATRMLLVVPKCSPEIFDRVRKEIVRLGYGCGEIANYRDRARVVREITGEDLGRGDPESTKVSNGLFGACLALYEGASEVILAGISLDSPGHNYTNRATRRKHALPDGQAIRKMIDRGLPVGTSEPQLAKETGLGLVR